MLRNLRLGQGAAALEALISMVFLFGVFFTMWSVARVVYDQSRLETSTQFASQAALQTYLRNAPAGCTESPTAEALCQEATSLTRDVARNVLTINACNESRIVGDSTQDVGATCLDDLGITSRTSIDPLLKIQCSSQIEAPDTSWTACSGAGLNGSQAVRVEMDTTLDTNWFLASVANGFGLGRENSVGTLAATAAAYSYAARPGALTGP
jgi:hypothetical protein